MAKMMNQFKVSYPGEMVAREQDVIDLTDEQYAEFLNMLCSHIENPALISLLNRKPVWEI